MAQTKKLRSRAQDLLKRAKNPIKRVQRWADKPKKPGARVRRWAILRNIATRRTRKSRDKERSRWNVVRIRWRRQVRKAKREARSTAFDVHMEKPWTSAARSNQEFRRWLLQRDLLSPNFPVREASGRGRNPRGTDVPSSLIKKAQDHAFMLEVARHRLGDRPLPILSWYRNPNHNAAVGGATNSRHLQADGTDFTVQTVNSFGGRFDRIMEEVFQNHGFGRYPSGSRHADTRGTRARW